MDKYYLALGRFADAFADAEDHIYEALGLTAGVDAATARALFSGVRPRGAIETIGRLYEARSKTLDPQLNEAFQHLVSINTFRDRVMHWGVFPFAGQLVSSNQHRAPSERHVRRSPVSVEILESATHDIETITTKIYLHMREAVAPEEFTDENISPALIAYSAPWRARFHADGGRHSI